MKSYKYVGAMVPPIPADKFVTSVFRNRSGRYFIQSLDGNNAIRFKKIKLTRKLKSPTIDIEVGEQAEFIYSFMTSDNTLFSGRQKEMEIQLVPLVYQDGLNVHSRLMISSFLKLYQKTLELIEESNSDLFDKGIDQKISSGLPFGSSREPGIDGRAFRLLVLSRFNLFRSLDNRIRIQDIIFLKNEKTFFENFQVNMDQVINREAIEDKEQALVISRVIMACSRNNPNLLHSMIIGHSGTLEFILQSRILLLPQQEVEALISEKASRDCPGLGDSVLKIGIDVDKQLFEIESGKNQGWEDRAPTKKQDMITDSDLDFIFHKVTSSTLN